MKAAEQLLTFPAASVAVAVKVEVALALAVTWTENDVPEVVAVAMAVPLQDEPLKMRTTALDSVVPASVGEVDVRDGEAGSLDAMIGAAGFWLSWR
jgi:hypothetical protein